MVYVTNKLQSNKLENKIRCYNYWIRWPSPKWLFIVGNRFGFCHHLVNVISVTLINIDHIKRLPLFLPNLTWPPTSTVLGLLPRPFHSISILSMWVHSIATTVLLFKFRIELFAHFKWTEKQCLNSCGLIIYQGKHRILKTAMAITLNFTTSNKIK